MLNRNIGHEKSESVEKAFDSKSDESALSP
jgi:hypothetical protein